MNDKAFMKRLAGILEIDETAVNSRFDLTGGAMDSVATIAAIALIDEQYGISVSGRELMESSSVGDLLSLIHNKSDGNFHEKALAI